MKILLIITDQGSFNNFLGEVAIKLLTKGHEVDVICSEMKVIDCKDKFPYVQLGVRFHFIDFPRGFNIIKQYNSSKIIRSLIRKIAPDLISIHFTTAMFTTLLCGKLNVKSIGTFHGVGYPIINGAIKKMIFKTVEHFCCRCLDQIWVLNKFDFKLLSKYYPKKLNLLDTKGLGCDLDKFNACNYNNDFHKTLRSNLGISGNDFVLTFTGRFVRFKGFSLVVKAFKALINEYKVVDLKLILIGGRDDLHETGLDDEEENWCKTHKSVIEIGFTSEVDKYLSITDLFVFPSEREGMPVCIIEALAMNVPILTIDTRGCSDLVTNGFNGLVLNSHPTVEEIAKAIIEMKNNKELMNKFRENIFRDRGSLDRNEFVDQQIRMFELI